MKDLSKVIQRPLITEQGTIMRDENNKYLFQVAPDANKHEIRQAVEHYFGVKVTDVHTMNYKGKTKRMGRFEGRRSAWKKAVVTLAADESIDLFDIV